MDECTFIVTKNNSIYVNWQTELLYTSFLEYHQFTKEYKFLALVTKDFEEFNFKYPHLFFNHTKSINNDNYIVYNRIISLKEYLNLIDPSENRYIVLLDPDMIFNKFFDLLELYPLDNNSVMGTPYYYLEKRQNALGIHIFQTRFSEHPDIEKFYQPIGCPLIINELLLSKIVDRWLKITIDLRTTYINKSPFFKNWLCEMYGLIFALAEQEINVCPLEFGEIPPYPTTSTKNLQYFYHYCQDVYDSLAEQNLIFSKRRYRPWKYLNPQNLIIKNPFARDFINKMNYFIYLQKKQLKDKKVCNFIKVPIHSC